MTWCGCFFPDLPASAAKISAQYCKKVQKSEEFALRARAYKDFANSSVSFYQKGSAALNARGDFCKKSRREQRNACGDMVHPRGFEPPACGLGNRRSILLSYGCINAYKAQKLFYNFFACLSRKTEIISFGSSMMISAWFSSNS